MTTTFVTLKILKMSVRYSQFSYIEFLASIHQRAVEVLLTIVITHPWLKHANTVINLSLKQALSKARIFNHGKFQCVATEFGLPVGVDSAPHSFQYDEINSSCRLAKIM
jgi:hypothetical protein